MLFFEKMLDKRSYILNFTSLCNWSLPLSQQNWSQLDFTQLSLNDLSKAFNLEYQNSQSLISSLRSQLDFSNLQILSWNTLSELPHPHTNSIISSMTLKLTHN